jgi:RNA polymerase sigma factor (sigma-70 family)
VRDYSAEEILSGIKNHDKDVLTYIYESFYQQINFFVNTNSGTDEDAQDIYQEALIVIYKKINEESLTELDCSFNTYLYSVCKLLWLKQLERNKIKTADKIEKEELQDFGEDMMDIFEKDDRMSLYQKHYRMLSKDCQKVLRLTLNKLSLKQVANIMGYKSQKYAKKKKYQCKEKLIESIKNDPKYNELT